MVPVELRLTNFLSYGTAAQPLDFEQFHVACLSGRNGQGKSALLDAMTWALWGEARKSAGNYKPDDEILRIGASRMQVEFSFDVEGDRYRVVRSYTRSASGKTSRPNLEVTVYEAETGVHRPLTGASVRETQRHLDDIIGLDYETFISSAFILQGRSDEFTKKKPNERKEILGRILNLGRYDRLCDMAREKEREWSDRLQMLSAEIERLQLSVQEEPKWLGMKAELQEGVAAKQARIEALRKEERAVTERLALLEAKTREAESGRQALASLRGREAQYQQDSATLRARIQGAEALVVQRKSIEQAYDLYEALQREREDLDTKSQLFRGLEKQIEQREAEMRERRLEWEKRVHATEVELKSNRTALQECAAQLIEEPVVVRSLKKAREAQVRLTEMNGALQQRKGLEDEIAALEKELHGLSTSIKGQLQAHQRQNEQDQAALPALEQLQAQQEQFRLKLSEREKLQQELEATKAKGQEQSEKIKELQGRFAAGQADLEKHRDNFERFQTVEDGVCPTCGTNLHSGRRDEVDAHFRETIAARQEGLARLQTEIAGGEAERDRLREGYRLLQQRLEPLAGIAEEQMKVEERIRAYNEARSKIAARAQEIESLNRLLAGEQYGSQQRERRDALRTKLRDLPFDDELFEKVRLDAAQVSRYEDQINALEQVAGRKEQLERAVKQGEQQESTLRAQVEDGSLLGPLQEQIRRLREQLGQIGFDAARLETVRQGLRDLANAGSRMKDLLHAQGNLTEWREQLERVGRDLEIVRAEAAKLTDRLAVLGAELEQRAVVEASREQLAQECKREEGAFHALQVQLGEVNARLDGAARDREALKSHRVQHSEATHQRQIYKHLRAAFGRHGIPSLIIEQTLPDLEDRANELLDRLTDGRMHVKLHTLKDKKTGGTKETLDIIITDEQGVARAYETFSGGEAFRVNFALRIALSQLLAERSGVRIRTLFIDEGFGTQDAQGLESLIEAIQIIQQDFDKILVITHLEELKEAFPVRIEVTKDPVEGSLFEMHGV